MASKQSWEDLKMTNEEVDKIGNALKDENFRKLFLDYAQEISDPENRKRYEDEMTQLENERGMDVDFIHPDPEYALVTSVNGDKKAFINICKNKIIDKPVSSKHVAPNGKRGLYWSIPHSFAPQKEDVDGKNKCFVYDVVFHPDACRMAETSASFKKLIEETAIDGIEKNFDVKMDRKNVKVADMKFKGVPTSTVKRKKREEGPSQKLKKDESGLLKNMPYPYDSLTTEEKMNKLNADISKQENEKAKISKKKTVKKVSTENNKNEPTVPKYRITHRSELDLQEYRNAPDARPSTRPKELVLTIDLPLLSSARPVKLDVFEKRVVLEATEPAAYKLDLSLPYPVDDENGSAKFDKSKHCLIVTLPVLPGEVPSLPVFNDGSGDNSDSNFSSTVEAGNETTKLIEVFNATGTDNDSGVEHDVTADTEDQTEKTPHCDHVVGTNKEHSQPAISYNMPEYTYSQDRETISLILQVKRVSEESVTKMYPSPNACHVRFVSVGSGCFPMYYSLFVAFPQGSTIAPSYCSVDVSDANVVLTLLKAKDAQCLWSTMQVGVDALHLQEIMFPIEENLELQLQRLDEAADGKSGLDSASGKSMVEVTEMSDKQITVKIQVPSEQSVPEVDESLLDDDSLSPSPEIKVVYDRVVPSLQSILKQNGRHSESSDDNGASDLFNRQNSICSPVPESPLSESEETSDSQHEFKRQKSVSFSDHVDSTVYKIGTSVSTLKTTLKNKRRKARKREEKRAHGRQRHNSSECSSSEEHGFVDENGHPTLILSNENASQKKKDKKKKVKRGKSGSSNSSKSESLEDTCSETDSVPLSESSEELSPRLCEVDGTAIPLPDFRTSGSNKGDKAAESDDVIEATVCEVNPCIEVINIMPNKGDNAENSDDILGSISNETESKPSIEVIDSDDEDNDEYRTKKVTTVVCADSIHETASESLQSMAKDDSVSVEPSVGNLSSKCDREVSSSTDQYSSHPQVDDMGEPGDESTAPVLNNDDESDSVEHKKESVEKIDTILSWNDRHGDASSIHNEHKTQCAFLFSNTVIYDLDED